MLRVDRQLCMTVYPVLQFGAWQRRQLHVDRVARRIEHPSVPAERQAGTLDSPAEQPRPRLAWNLRNRSVSISRSYIHTIWLSVAISVARKPRKDA